MVKDKFNAYCMAGAFYLVVIYISMLLGSFQVHKILGPIDYIILGGALLFLLFKMIADKFYYSGFDDDYGDAVASSIIVFLVTIMFVVILSLLEIHQYLSILDYTLLSGTLVVFLLRQFSHKLYNLAR